MRAWLAPAALVLLAALETIASLWLANRTPNPDDYAALRAPMQELLGANDALVVQPRWAEPHVRRALGSELLPLSRIAPADLSAVPAAVEISLGGHSAPELHSFAEVASQRLGPFTASSAAQSATRAPQDELRRRHRDSEGECRAVGIAESPLHVQSRGAPDRWRAGRASDLAEREVCLSW